MLPKPNIDIGEKTRRAVLKAAGAALGVASIGTAAGHPGSLTGENNKFYGGTEGYLGNNVAETSSDNVSLVGYHSGGGVGPASYSGQPENAHRGAFSEFRIHDDLAFASVFSARGEDSQRGVAIFDISDFTRAEGAEELDSAELSLLSFVRNDNTQAACMDVKVSDDGNYIFVCKQAVTALFGEAQGAEPNTDNHGNSAGAASLVAVDVSDPGNPEVTDEESLSHWSVGPHNGWYHQIGGEEYFFTVHGTSGAASKVNTFQFDRASGQLQQVNAWSWDTNLSQGSYGADSNQWYHHDINVQEDPRYGVPLAYLHCWDAGLRIFDVSDPLNVQEVGVFEQYGAHHAVPAPALIEIDGEERRVAVTGHENPDSSYHAHIDGHETGRYNLVDCDPLDDALDPESDVEKVYLGCATSVREGPAEQLSRAPYQMYDAPDDPTVKTLRDESELDYWALIEDGQGWGQAPGFDDEAGRAEQGKDPGAFQENGFSDFRVSTHNIDMDTDGRLYAGHYHAGARFFETADGTIDPAGYFREGKEIPTDRAMAYDTPEQSPVSIDGLTASTPFFWNAVERNGVVFAGGINSGPHVMHKEGAAVGNDTPVDVDIEREHDASVVTAGQTHRVTIRADADEDVVVRDAVPATWTVYEKYTPSNVEITEIEGYRNLVEVELTENDGVLEGTYVVEAPDGTAPENSGSYTFGPVEYARSDGNGNALVDSKFGGGNSTTNRLWRKENGAVTSINVVGIDTAL
ncbi:hypothetical protein HWV23_07175 [Natronomonas halophila]|uniref:hypothetical protein n=1 Tax=Natronomonas halophila TaxID=2747817 RepID=UPI0015B5ADA3|nr:hypothetical protein [Natronomonas halophila]QLD85515.1 hypothetical protein HWV23_07175 [Natronomonas halophila]